MDRLVVMLTAALDAAKKIGCLLISSMVGHLQVYLPFRHYVPLFYIARVDGTDILRMENLRNVDVDFK